MTNKNSPHAAYRDFGVSVENAGLNPFEIAVLTQMRYFFMNQAGLWPAYTPSPDEFTRLIFHTDDADEIAIVIYQFVMCVATSRTETFDFSSPFCAGCSRIMTDHERHLMMILKSLRKGRTGRAIIHALMICEKGPINDVIAAASRVVQLSGLDLCEVTDDFKVSET